MFQIPVQHTDFLLTKGWLAVVFLVLPKTGSKKVYLQSPPNVQRRLETRTSTIPGSRPVYRLVLRGCFVVLLSDVHFGQIQGGEI